MVWLMSMLAGLELWVFLLKDAKIPPSAGGDPFGDLMFKFFAKFLLIKFSKFVTFVALLLIYT